MARPALLPALCATLLILLAGAAWAEDPCANTDECLNQGRCYMSNLGDCATGDEACRHSYACLHQGMCAMDPDTEQCVAVSQRDCLESMDCDDRGQCEFVAETRSCEVGEGACRDTANCASTGHCTLRGERCVVGSSRDCEEARVCEDHGQCELVGTHCAPTREEHCASSTHCTEHGGCTLVDSAGDAHPALERGGRCSHAGQCSDAAACTRYGNCRPGARDRCVPGGEDDCLRSTACAEQGRCTFLPPPEPPADDGMALMASLREPTGPACIVGGPEDCERACAGRSHCEYAPNFMGGGVCDTVRPMESILTGRDDFILFERSILYGPEREGDGEGTGIGGGGVGSIGGIGGIGTPPPSPSDASSEDEGDREDGDDDDEE